MAFGIAISDGTDVAVGTYGKVVRFNLSAYEVRTVRAIQLQDPSTTPDTMGDVVSAGTTPETLQAYPEDASAPDAAFAQSGDILDVFVLEATWPVANAPRLGIWFTRNAQNVAVTTDKLDIPQEAKTLARALALREGYILKNKPVPFQIDEEVRAERARLGL